jgi:hypothetical protein
LNCIIATMGSNSGMKAPSTPSSFIRRSARSGLPCFSSRSRKIDRLGVGAHLVVDQVQIRRDQAHRVGVQQIAGAQRLFEDAQQVQLVGKESGGFRRRCGCTTL